MLQRLLLGVLLWLLTWKGEPAAAQEAYVIGTVTRAPFSMVVDDQDTGFSISLWEALATELELPYELQRFENFRQMIDAVENNEVDAAIANISITADREMRMDFTQPIFESGLQIMVHDDTGGTGSVLRAIFTPQLALMALAALVLLSAMGMLMWLFERKKHSYFGRTAKEALFPSFWWALNLIISSGYEEEMPRSALGRVFGVVMIIGSLFVVSIFVANITAAITLDALSENVEGISDLEGRQVGTTEGSTTSTYLNVRGVAHQTYDDFDIMLTTFENHDLDAIVFDGPILAYYVQNTDHADARLIDRVFQEQGYGIALPSGSSLREPLDRVLLRLRESGDYDALKAEWFGAAYSDQ